MQFKVPQFIDIEDKVVGNLSFRQFAYLAGGAGLVYLSGRLLPLILAIIFVPAFAGLALALAFVKINEKPFAKTLEAFIRYHLKSRLYLWKKHTKVPPQTPVETPAQVFKKKFTERNLQTLSQSLDSIDPTKK